MRSLAEAARILDAAGDPPALDALIASLGFPSTALPLNAIARDRLGLPSCVTSARVSAGDGTLRALIVQLDGCCDLRDALTTIARRLAVRVPHLLWLTVAIQSDCPTIAIAAWSVTGAAPRLATLITERGRVVDSDAETLCALAACANTPGGDVMRHLGWLDVLGREAVTLRFFRALQGVIGKLGSSLPAAINDDSARELSLLLTSRMLFLSFLATKGWLNKDFGFLANGFADCMATGGRYQRRVLDPLFFGTLNTRPTERAARARAFGRIPFLNGGLFARSPLERIHRRSSFSDDALGSLFGELLVRFRFTACEDARTWSEAAIDPEMLGKAFESLMTSLERRNDGVYYTPQTFVERVTVLTLSSALATPGVPAHCIAALLSGEPVDGAPATAMLGRLATIRILDPACGSGAFLVYALQRVTTLHTLLGDARSVTSIRRSVLTDVIFGVDRNPTAVWLCELRLWLAAVIESEERDPMRVAALPNLDRNIRVGDSLAGASFNSRASAVSQRGTVALRRRYSRSSGPRKVALGKVLDRAERERAVAEIDRELVRIAAARREIAREARATDLFDTRRAPRAATRAQLAKLRASNRALQVRRAVIQHGGALPFEYPVQFADICDAGGFDAILGNPPWVRVHNIPRPARERYRTAFHTFRYAAWRAGSDDAGAGSGFGGQTDVAALFVERSHDLLAPGGVFGLLLPAKLWRSLAGGGVRQFVMDRMQVTSIEDCSDAPAMFDAAVYPSVIVAVRRSRPEQQPAAHSITADTAAVGVHRGRNVVRWPVHWPDVPIDATPGAPWLLLPPDTRRSFDRLSHAGVSLAASEFGRPLLGVKSGCNAAFVVTLDSAMHGIARVRSSHAGAERTGEVEADVLRPLVRGETLTPWTFADIGERILWTHDGAGQPRAALPGRALAWLAASRAALERRTDARPGRPWWSLFRTESAAISDPRVVWNDFGRTPRAAVLPAGDPTVPLNTCYVVRCLTLDDAYALTALLNSPLAAAWLAPIAEPARGGYHRYLGWTMAAFPIPRDWEHARTILAPLTRCAIAGDVPSSHELQRAALHAYHLSCNIVAPLMDWASLDDS